ncbi:MAG: hypothetical protein WA160_16065 [Pseudobdellovibrio sp.]
MKMIFTTLIILISSISFAGNGSGTMMQINPSTTEGSGLFNKLTVIKGQHALEDLVKNNIHQVVYDLGSVDNNLRFAHGKFDGQNWIVNKIEISDNNSTATNALKESLIQSKAINSWVTVH